FRGQLRAHLDAARISAARGRARRGNGREFRDAARRHLPRGARAHHHAPAGAGKSLAPLCRSCRPRGCRAARARALDAGAAGRAPATLSSLSAELAISQRELEAPLHALRARGIAEEEEDGELQLTAVGAAMRDRVVAARRTGLADMLARWRPEQHPDVLALIEG